MKRLSGVSIVELIVIIGILAILLIVSISSITKWIKRSNVRTYAEQLISDLEMARSLSMKYNSSCISFTSNSYKIYAPDCCSNNTCTINTPKIFITLPNGITLSSSSSFIVFDINTLPKINDNVTITITGYEKTFKAIINPNGGIYLEF